MDGGLCVPNTKAEGPLAGSRWGFLKQRDILHGRWEHGEGTPPPPVSSEPPPLPAGATEVTGPRAAADRGGLMVCLGVLQALLSVAFLSPPRS